MKYIRTKDGKILENNWCSVYDAPASLYNNIEKQANTIEELCDEFVLFYDNEETEPDLTYRGGFNDLYFQNELKHSAKCYSAIWTDKGLIYVAKMNDKGELELL